MLFASQSLPWAPGKHVRTCAFPDLGNRKMLKGLKQEITLITHLEILLWRLQAECVEGSKKEGFGSGGNNSRERKGVLEPRQRQ